MGFQGISKDAFEASKWSAVPRTAGKAPLKPADVAAELLRLGLTGQLAWGVALSHALADQMGVPLPQAQLRAATEWAVGRLGNDALALAAGDIAEMSAMVVTEAVTGGLLRRSTGERMPDGSHCPRGSYVGPWGMCIGAPSVGIPEGDGGAQQTPGGGMDIEAELAALEAELSGDGGDMGALGRTPTPTVEVLPRAGDADVASALGFGLPAFLTGTWGRIAIALMTSPVGKQVATYVAQRLGLTGTPGEETPSGCRMTARFLPERKRMVAELALCSEIPRGLSEAETEWWEIIRIARRPDALQYLQSGDTKGGCGCGCNGGGNAG